MHVRNISAVLSNPALGVEYLRWRISHARTGNASFKLINGAKIGNFVNFSEYHSMVGCISATEQRFFLERVAREAGDIIDIGANIGIVSVLLARQFPDRTIHAIEPVPNTFETLRKNVAFNGLERVRTHRVAIASGPGSLAFNAHPLERATARIATAGDTHVQMVEATTLDAFVAQHGIGAIALLKVDVEGFETGVFAGATDVLARRLPRIIFMEVCPALTVSAGFDPAEPARTVKQAGYAWFRLEESGTLVPVEPADTAGVTLENWVALPV